MNSLRKTFLALSLIAVVPATVQAYSWADFKANLSQGKNIALDACASAVGYAQENAPRVSKFARENKKTTAAIAVAGTAGIVGAGYLAKRYKVAQTAAHVAGTPSRLVKAAYNKFAAQSRTRKAGLVIGGTVAVVGAAYLAKILWSKYNAPVNPTE